MMDDEAQAVFTAQAEGLVESLEAQLLSLRDAPGDQALINAVFRDLHTLKGSGAMFGRDDIAGFLHDFETAFESVRDGSIGIDADLITISLAARDHVANLLQSPGADGGDAILSQLADHLGRGNGPADAPDPAAPNAPLAEIDDGDGDWQLAFALPQDTLSLGGKPEIVLDDLRDLGARNIRCHADALPPLDEIEPDTLYLRWTATLDASVEEDDIRNVFMFHDTGLDMTLTRDGASDDTARTTITDSDAREASAKASESPPKTTPPAAEARKATPPQGGGLMRVPAERLDDLMDRVGELVIAEARLVEIAARLNDPGLIAVAEDIQRLVTGMRDTTMSIRMTPIGAITGRFKRLVHDLSGKLGRPLTFEVEGEETELDKTVVERLTEPLMHIVRNAADHGLEDADERVAMGKPRQGEIRLRAGYAGAEVVISLSDDGRGLSRDAILARAVKNGLLPEGATPDDETLFGLIFEPGFSTAAKVTELSGRGVGMDVVRKTIDSLRGTIEVQSEPGHGTTVTLRLPLTLAIIDGLLVETADERYVIPLAAVDEIVELPADLAEDTTGNAFLDIRESLVPFLRLRHLLDSPGTPEDFQKVVVVASAEGRVGLVVDRIIGSNQTVIKQLSPLHSGVKEFSGATILGDGAVALILDVPQLVARGRCDTDGGREAA